MNTSRTADIGRLVAAVAVSQLAGAVSSVFAASSVSTWYVTLAKPSFTPPGWLFGPVWVALYALMGIAAWLVWREGLDERTVRVGLVLFAVQLVLNAAWSLIFFWLRLPAHAFVEIVVLWAAAAATTVVFARVSKLAAALMTPYIVWTAFAAVVNFSIARLNW